MQVARRRSRNSGQKSDRPARSDFAGSSARKKSKSRKVGFSNGNCRSFVAEVGFRDKSRIAQPDPTLRGVVCGKSRKVGKSDFPREIAGRLSPKSDSGTKVGSPIRIRLCGESCAEKVEKSESLIFLGKLQVARRQSRIPRQKSDRPAGSDFAGSSVRKKSKSRKVGFS